MDKSDVVVIGGVAAGPKTAATLARRDPSLKITVFEKSEYISFATCGMPYFASGDVNAFSELTFTSYGIPRDTGFFNKSKGFNVVTGAEVTRIDRENKTVEVKNLSGETVSHQYEKLVIATGATPNDPPFSVVKSDKIVHFTRPEDAIAFRKAAQTGQIGKAVIVGAGFIGCELAEAVGGMWGIETVLIEKEKQVLPYILDPEMSDIVIRELKRNDVETHIECMVHKIETDDNGNPVVFIDDNQKIEADFVFLCVGVSPNVILAKEAGLEIGSTGAIKVNDRMMTSDENIYAGGDCVESLNLITGKPFYIPMGSLANRHGRVIAENIVGNEASFPGVTGAFLVKVYDTNVGSVGLSQDAAERIGLETDAVWGAFPDKPDYYPESKSFSLKLVFDKNEKVIGLQAVGEGDIFRRIDVMSLLLKNGATLDDVLDFEQGYAPPYAEALDPLHHIAATAKSKLRGFGIVGPAEIVDDGESIWLDVREVDEASATSWDELDKIKESGRYHNIPLNDLRENLGKLDKSKRIKIICRRGPRSYQAAVILKAAGFEQVQFVGGGTKAAIS